MEKKTVTGNFLSQPNRDFPLDCGTLDTLQNNAALVAAIGNIAGDKVILYGCELSHGDTQRDPGYVFVRTNEYPQGEVLYWEGGNITEGMYLKLEDVLISTHGYEYPKAYTKRSLAPGVGGEFCWADFRKPRASAEIEAQIAALVEKQGSIEAAVASTEPLGVIKMFAGNSAPENYHMCDGAELRITEYPELYAVIGDTFNNAKRWNDGSTTTQPGHFKLPDLRGRFVVGYNNEDYNNKNELEYDIGFTGGEKMHTLNVEELPPHSHDYTIYTPGKFDSNRFSGKNNNDSDVDEHRTTASTGGGAAHENRPPYYVLAYIMRIK